MIFTRHVAFLCLACSSWGVGFAFVVTNRVGLSTYYYYECNLSSHQPQHDASVAASALFAVPGEQTLATKQGRRRRPASSLQQKNHRESNNNNYPQESTVVIIYHKPPNVITSHSNADEISQTAKALLKTNEDDQDTSPRRTVYEDIYSMNGFVSDGPDVGTNIGFGEATKIQSKLHAVGRLDADTTGLLLLTNDGALVHKITNPNAKSDDGPVQKTYEATIMGSHTLPTTYLQQSTSILDDSSSNNDYGTYPLQQLLDVGVTLSKKHGGQTKPVDALSILSHPTRSTTRVSITISEGKNRQIRRSFHAVGSGVMKLHRASVGKLSLHGLEGHERDGGLKEGQWRLLSDVEIKEGLGWKCRYIDGDQHSIGAREGRTAGANDERQGRQRLKSSRPKTRRSKR